MTSYLPSTRKPILDLAERIACCEMSPVAQEIMRLTECEMHAAWSFRRARAELSTFMEAIWPGDEDCESENDRESPAPEILLPPVLSATLDELEARCRHTKAAWEKARRGKKECIDVFLQARVLIRSAASLQAD